MNHVSQDFGGVKALREAQEKKIRIDALKKKSFLDYYANICKEKKKREEHRIVH